MSCKSIEKVRAKQKANKILELISRKIEKEQLARLKKLKTVQKEIDVVDVAIKAYDEASKAEDEAQKVKDKALQKLNIVLDKFELSTYRYASSKDSILQNLKYTGCTVTEEDHKELQKAQDMIELGMKKESKEIFDKLIKKYKLLE